MTQQIYIGTLRWQLLHAIIGPETVTIGHLLRKRIQYKPFPFQLGLRSRHEVRKNCCTDGLLILDFALTVERTYIYTESCISCLVSSTPLPWDQAGQKCLQRREKDRLRVSVRTLIYDSVLVADPDFKETAAIFKCWQKRTEGARVGCAKLWE